jgi:hypothetical protein
VRRATALGLFVVGYAVLALFGPAAAVGPALLAFCAGSFVLGR